jgi:hypothetical protein
MLPLQKERRCHLSHITRIEIEIRDLGLLQEACNRLGIEFHPEEKSFRWYGGVKDCEGAIRIPNARYEIGLVREKNRYGLLWDSYATGGLEARLGKGAGKLKQAYAVERVRLEAKLRGYRLRESKTETGVRLVMTV